jgi:hypothetical protein
MTSVGTNHYQIGTSVPGGGASSGTPIELTGAPETWQSGAAAGDVGEYTATGAIYLWHATLGRWVRPETFNAGTLASVHEFVGDEDEAAWVSAGYTITKSGAGAVTTTTIGSLDYTTLDAGTTNSDTCYAVRSGITAGAGRLYQGWAQVISASGSSTQYFAMFPFARNGSRIYWFRGARTATTADFSLNNGTSVGMADTSATDLQAAPVWIEILIEPEPGRAFVWVDHSTSPVASVAGNQCTADTPNDEWFGDSSTSGKSQIAFGAGFLVADIT